MRTVRIERSWEMQRQSIRIIGVSLVALLLITGIQAGVQKKPGHTRIVNGDIITIDKAPYAVQLRDSLNRQYCGGTLVTPQHVITAAHCFDEAKAEEITVVGGASGRFDPGVQRKVASMVKASTYDPSTFDMDIAVLKLDKPMTGTDIEPVSLCPGALKPGDLIQVSGWGKLGEYNFASDELRTVRLPIISKETCTKMVLASDPYGLGKSMICAYSPNKDSCSGDSGGPAMLGGELCAVVSWGHGCAREDSPGIYTSIDVVRSFITEALEN